MAKRKAHDAELDELVVEVLEPQTKKLITALSLKIAGPNRLMALNVFRATVNEIGFPLPETTLSRWRTQLALDPDYFIPAKKSGRPRSLAHGDEQLLGGFILHENAMNRRVGYREVNAFLKDNLNVETSLSTLVTYVHAGGFSQQVAKVRPKSDARVSRAQKLLLGLDFIDELKEQGFYRTLLHRMFCIDVTHTSHGKVRPVTLAPVNAYA
jgi:hypothetical protein